MPAGERIGPGSTQMPSSPTCLTTPSTPVGMALTGCLLQHHAADREWRDKGVEAAHFHGMPRPRGTIASSASPASTAWIAAASLLTDPFPPTLDLQPQGPPGSSLTLSPKGGTLVPTTKVQRTCAREHATASRCPP
jgi:hypothetical protein